MNSDKLAFELMYHAHEYVIIDVTEVDSLTQQIPTSAHIKYSELHKPEHTDLITQRYKTNIFVSETPGLAQKAAILAQEKGNKNPVYFSDSVSEFRLTVFDVQ